MPISDFVLHRIAFHLKRNNLINTKSEIRIPKSEIAIYVDIPCVIFDCGGLAI